MIQGPTPDRAAIQQVVGDFLTSILPPGMPIFLGQENRVPEPAASDFVIFTELFQIRLATNEDGYSDVAFIGNVSGNILTIVSVEFGEITVGSTLFGPTVTPYTTILEIVDDTCTLSKAQAEVASGSFAAGVEQLMQATELSFQIDVHGPNSANNAQTISTLWRDARGTSYFHEVYPGVMAPFYADDPRQTPFRNDQDQIEYRWTIDAKLQVNQTITAPQQFAAQLVATVQDFT